MKKFISVILSSIFIILGTLWFINNKQVIGSAKESQLKIVTTNSILEDMVNQVVGSKAEVYSIVSRGTDPHEYEPKPSDIEATVQADLIFHNGLNLETGGNGWFQKLTQTANKKDDVQVFAVSKKIRPQYLTTNEHEVDPHAWLSIPNGIKYIEEITAVVVAKDPQNKDYYEKNAQNYIAKLTELDKIAKDKFATLPASKKVLVTSEGAFKYFGQEYGLQPTYIWEINTESQGTPDQMKLVLEKISKNDVKSLFVETSVSPKAMEKVSEESGIKIHAKVFTDSLAKKGKNGDTYLDMMKWNIDKIFAGLSK